MALTTVVALYLAELITTTNARATILTAGQDRLMAVASGRAAEVHGVLAAVRADVRAKANNPVILEATRGFVSGWERMGSLAAPTLRASYMHGASAVPDHVPKAGDQGSAYRQVHGYYHRFFANHADARDYANLYIVSPAGRVVYSVRKKASFGADLHNGLFEETGLAMAFARAVNARDNADISTDFEPYEIETGQLSAFFGVSILGESGRVEGVLIIRLPASALAVIVDRPDGLGQTGQVAILGVDMVTRTGPEIAFAAQPTGAQPGHDVVRDGGLAVLGADGPVPQVAAFAPFVFQGMQFAVVAWQERREIFASAQLLRQETLRDGVPALALVCVIGIMLARSISGPLEAVGSAMGSVAAQRYDFDIPCRNRRDEIGTIARRLDLFRASLVAADATERENAFKSAAFEAASAALMLTDRDMTIIYVNRRLVELMTAHRIALERNVSDFRPSALPGRDLAALFPGAARLQEAAETDDATAEIRLGQSHLELSMAPVRAHKSTKILGYVVEWKDVTERWVSDAVIGALNATLPLASFSNDGRLIEANPPFLRWVLRQDHALLGEHWNTIFHNDSPGGAGSWSVLSADTVQHQRFQICPRNTDPLSAILSRVKNDRGRVQRYVLVAGSDVGVSPVWGHIPGQMTQLREVL